MATTFTPQSEGQVAGFQGGMYAGMGPGVHASQQPPGSFPANGGAVYAYNEPDFAMPRPDPSIISRLSVAIRRTTLDSEGALAQIWVPCHDNNGNVSLVTKNQFYIVSGCGDELAEYRQASTKYSFAIQSRQATGIGMPGRVFSSELPEVTSNVQNFTQAEYPRLPDAQRSQILSSVVLPVFWGDRVDRSCQLVLELIPSNPQESFASMISLVNQSLRSVGLTSFGANSSEVVLVRNGSNCRAITLKELGQGDGVYKRMGPVESLPRNIGSFNSANGFNSRSSCQITEEGTLPLPHGEGCGDSSGRGEGGSGNNDEVQDKKTKDTKAAASVALHTVMQLGTDTLEALGLKGIVSKEGEEKTVTVGRRREDRPQVSLKTLQDHFVYSLKEAANKLGMCPTTLKRCCRQHGITRWPKRRLTSMGRSLTTLQEILQNANSAEADTPALQKVAEALSNFNDGRAGAEGAELAGVSGGSMGAGKQEGGMASRSPPLDPPATSAGAAGLDGGSPPLTAADGTGGVVTGAGGHVDGGAMWPALGGGAAPSPGMDLGGLLDGVSGTDGEEHVRSMPASIVTGSHDSAGQLSGLTHSPRVSGSSAGGESLALSPMYEQGSFEGILS